MGGPLLRPRYVICSACKDIITRLLDKREWTRLGSKSGASEVKQHKWFAKINWGLLRNTQPPVSQRIMSARLHKCGESAPVVSICPRRRAWSWVRCAYASYPIWEGARALPVWGHASRRLIGSSGQSLHGASDNLVLSRLRLSSRRGQLGDLSEVEEALERDIPAVIADFETAESRIQRN